MSDDDLLTSLKSADSLDDNKAISAICAWKLSEHAGVRKEAKKALERCRPVLLHEFMLVFKGKLGENQAKLAKKFATLDSTTLDGIEPLDLAAALDEAGAPMLHVLLDAGGEHAKAAVRRHLEDGDLRITDYKNKPFPSLKRVAGIKRLELGSCGLKTLPDFVFDLDELESIYSFNNRLTMLRGLERIKTLKKIHLAKAPLNKGVGDLPALEDVRLYHDIKLKDPDPASVALPEDVHRVRRAVVRDPRRHRRVRRPRAPGVAARRHARVPALVRS